MAKRKNKWVPVYDGDGELVCIVNDAGEFKSLGRAAKADRVELRAMELASGARQTKAEERGYDRHLYDADPRSPAEWAGWLEREILLAGDDIRAIGTAAFNALCEEEAHPAGDPKWKERVLEKCDEVDREQAIRSLEAPKEVPAATLAGIDQSEPTPAPEAPLHDVHSDEEVTHVGAVDERFDNGGEL